LITTHVGTERENSSFFVFHSQGGQNLSGYHFFNDIASKLQKTTLNRN
jgi:hypothetical protein